MPSVRIGRSARSASRRKASRSPAVRYLRIPSAVCSCMPVCGAGEGALARLFRASSGAWSERVWAVLQPGRAGLPRLHPPLFHRAPSAGLAPSSGAVLVAAAALGPENVRKSVDRGTRIGVRVEPAAAFGADAAPLPDQEGATEQVGPNLHPIIAPFVQGRADPHERGRLREQRQLDRCRPGRGGFATSGHKVTGSVSRAADLVPRKAPAGVALAVFCYSIDYNVSDVDHDRQEMMSAASKMIEIQAWFNPDRRYPRAI